MDFLGWIIFFDLVIMVFVSFFFVGSGAVGQQASEILLLLSRWIPGLNILLLCNGERTQRQLQFHVSCLLSLTYQITSPPILLPN